jgi:hypothetical protein
VSVPIFGTAALGPRRRPFSARNAKAWLGGQACHGAVRLTMASPALIEWLIHASVEIVVL